MKNIKLSFFSTIIFANSMSGMEYLLLKQLVTLPGEMQNLLHTSENHHENLQQAQDSRKFSRENHDENLQQAKDNRQITKEDHEENQKIALDRRRVSLTQEASNRLVHNSNVEIQLLLNAQRRALIAQETKQKLDPLNIEVEAQVSKAENTFRLCLVKNRDNFDLGSFGIPKICEDSAKALRLLGYRSLVNELTEEFQK